MAAPQRAQAVVAISGGDLAQLPQNSATLAKARALAEPSAWASIGRDADKY